MLRKFRLPVFLILLTGACVALIVSARNYLQNALTDRSIITGDPCRPPCWQGIEPGITSGEQALNILGDLFIVDPGSIKPNGTLESSGVLWDYRLGGKRRDAGMHWTSGVVQEIRLGINFDLTVEEVIDHFGTPENVRVAGDGTPEFWYWLIILYYPEQGVEWIAYTEEYSNLIEPVTSVEVIHLYSAKSLEARIREIEETYSVDLDEDEFIPWEGYGDLTELYLFVSMEKGSP